MWRQGVTNADPPSAITPANGPAPVRELTVGELEMKQLLPPCNLGPSSKDRPVDQPRGGLGFMRDVRGGGMFTRDVSAGA
jgi:hypothetical protein